MLSVRVLSCPFIVAHVNTLTYLRQSHKIRYTKRKKFRHDKVSDKK